MPPNVAESYYGMVENLKWLTLKLKVFLFLQLKEEKLEISTLKKEDLYLSL